MTEIRTITIVGAGQMGSGIAQVAAVAGYDVLLVDVAPGQLERATVTIQESLTKRWSKERLAQEDADAAVTRIRTHSHAEDADLLIEAATEDVDLKLKIFKQLDDVAHEGAILASNTSSIPITRLAARTSRPAAVVGMHFFNPVPLDAPGRGDPRAGHRRGDGRRRARARPSGWARRVAEARDVPGFISNRILVPMINEAAYCLMEGVGDAEAIDTVMKLGMNHPMGPLTLADLIGLSIDRVLGG